MAKFTMPPATGLPMVRSGTFEAWAMSCFRELERLSFDQPNVAEDFTISNLTESRTLDASAATLAQLRDVVATLITDMRRGGQKRAK